MVRKKKPLYNNYNGFWKCNSCSSEFLWEHEVIGHIASEHLAKRQKKTTSYCGTCGMTVAGCSKLGQCSESKKRNRENVKKLLDTPGIIP